MTLDEAIKHCLEVADKNEIDSITYKNCKEIKTNMYEKLLAEKVENDCLECAADHRQLAEWLTELKQWRRVYGVCPSYEMCIPECKEGYNAQIAEYKRLLKVAVNDMNSNNFCHRFDSCKVCSKKYNISCDKKFQWRYTDRFEKPIGGEPNGI